MDPENGTEGWGCDGDLFWPKKLAGFFWDSAKAKIFRGIFFGIPTSGDVLWKVDGGKDFRVVTFGPKNQSN